METYLRLRRAFRICGHRWVALAPLALNHETRRGPPAGSSQLKTLPVLSLRSPPQQEYSASPQIAKILRRAELYDHQTQHSLWPFRGDLDMAISSYYKVKFIERIESVYIYHNNLYNPLNN